MTLRKLDSTYSNNLILQDPFGFLYENLFFFLTLGKFDCILAEEFNSTIGKYQYYEEFLIVEEAWKDKLNYLENMLPIIILRDLREVEIQFKKNENLQVDFKISFLIYKNLTTGQLIGLGLRIYTYNSKFVINFAPTPDDRLQKAMYLLTRGLLNSNCHSIEQIEFNLPV